MSIIAQKRENTAHPVYESGIHSTSSEDVDLDLVSPALSSEEWYSGVLTPNCAMICGDGNSGRQRSSTEITLHASEEHIPVHMASKSFHEDLDRDTPTSKCVRERENTVHPVNGFGIHSTAHVDDDRDLLWPALLSEARHTGVPVLNCSDGYGYSGREHSSNEVTQYVCVRNEGWVVDVPGCSSTDEQSSNISCSGATYSVTLTRSECRWRTRRRVTCLTGLAEEQHFPTVDQVSPEQTDLLAMGGRVAFLMLWANDIEASGGTPEGRRAEYRQLFGEMCLFVEDLDEAERKSFHHLILAADLEHDATIDPEGEMRDIRDGTRQILMYLLEVQMAPPRPRIRRRSGGNNEWRVLRRGIGFV